MGSLIPSLVVIYVPLLTNMGDACSLDEKFTDVKIKVLEQAFLDFDLSGTHSVINMNVELETRMIETERSSASSETRHRVGKGQSGRAKFL